MEDPLRNSITAPKPFVFVAMPFAEAFDDAYEAAIKPACEAAGAYAERVDDQVFQGNILQRIYNQIAKADLIVADTTGRNVNVLYEVGYAHALRKHVIFLTRGTSDVVFDPTHHPYIVYERLVDLRSELERKVRDLLETIEQRTSPIAIPVSVMIDDVVLDPVIARDVTVAKRDAESDWVGFHLVVQNPALRFIRPLALQIGMIMPRHLEVSTRYAGARMEQMRLGDDAMLRILRMDFNLLPGAGTNLWMTCHPERKCEDGETLGPFRRSSADRRGILRLRVPPEDRAAGAEGRCRVTGPPPFALAILPSGGAFDDSWELAIQPACEAAGAYAERLDAQLSPETVLQRIQNLIAKADLVIVDMTEPHANIFYATGYAHALDKQVILLTKKAADIPFDLKHYPHISGNLTELRPELERRARHLLYAGVRGAPLVTPVEISVNRVELSADVPETVMANDHGRSGLWFDVEIRNQAGWWLRPVSLQLGLITPSHYFEVSGGSGTYVVNIPIDASRRLHLSQQEFRILPGSWAEASLIAFTRRSTDKPEAETFAIRVLTESGYFDFPFTLRWPVRVPESGC